MRVAIVGAGVTGLSAAYFLTEARRAGRWRGEVALIERDRRPGGKVQTRHEDGFVVEGGPDSLLAYKPDGVGLVRALGLEAEVVAPVERRVYLLTRGRLEPVPGELLRLAPSRPWEVLGAACLPWRARLRAALEPLVPPRPSDGDESVGAFMRRRLGATFAERLAEPLMAGVHAGDLDRLSMRALYPSFLDLERRHGSLARGLMAGSRSAGGNGSPFVTLRSGLGTLIERLAANLRDVRLVCGRSVVALAPHQEDGTAYRVILDDGSAVEADRVILTTPARLTAGWLASFASRTAELLGRLSFASTGVVTLAFRRSQVGHDLRGSGFLVPHAERFPLTGCTWSSSKWPDRAPEGTVLVRGFVGWAGDATALDRDDADLVALVGSALRPLLRIEGEPLRAWVDRWPEAMPQYEVGHLEWVAAVEASLRERPGLLLAGSSYRGVGIPDCVRQAREAVESLVAEREASERGG